MQLIGVLAALANRHRAVLVNGSVGFTTFAMGDMLSQGARPPPPLPPVMSAVSAPTSKVANLSWQQQLSERTREVDLARSAKVGLLGIMLNGFALGTWYRVLDRYLGADRTRMRTVLSKCVVDQMVYAPFSITSFVSYAAVLNGGGVQNVVGEAKRNLQETFWSTWLMDWKVWPAANLVMFRLIPSSYRPSFASVVQVAWQAYMSSVSYDNQHLAIRETHDEDTPVSIRGGAVEGQRVEGVHEAPSPGIMAPSLLSNRPKVSLSDRRVTGRYAYRPREGNTAVNKGASSSVVLERAGGVLNPSRRPKDKEL